MIILPGAIGLSLIFLADIISIYEIIEKYILHEKA